MRLTWLNELNLDPMTIFWSLLGRKWTTANIYWEPTNWQEHYQIYLMDTIAFHSHYKTMKLLYMYVFYR